MTKLRFLWDFNDNMYFKKSMPNASQVFDKYGGGFGREEVSRLPGWWNTYCDGQYHTDSLEGQRAVITE